LRAIGENAAAQEGVRFHYEDFRPGFRRARDTAKESGLYMQKYCGCIYSEIERAAARVKT
jgi:predicted adenine nucleotide alpha hydrolase (AANH) superfamily ATPase